MRRLDKWGWTAGALFLVGSTSRAQLPGFSVPATPSPAAVAAPSALPTPVPIPEVVAQAESASLSLHGIDTDVSNNQGMTSATQQIAILTREIVARIDDTQKVLSARPSLDTLRGISTDWLEQSSNLTQLSRSISARADELDRQIALLARMDLTWDQTFQTAKKASVPANILQRIQKITDDIDRVGGKLGMRQSEVLELQSKVLEQQARVASVLLSVRQARDDAYSRLFLQDSAPLWSLSVLAGAGREVVGQTDNTFTPQFVAVGAYFVRCTSRFFWFGIVWLLLTLGVFRVRRQVQRLRDTEPAIERAARVLDSPLATAFVLSLGAAPYLFQQAPRLLWAAIGAVALIPTVFILRRLVERHLFSILNALVLCYCFDQIRSVAASLQSVSRLLFVAEMLGVIGFLVYLTKTAQLSEVPNALRDRFWRMTRSGAQVALVAFTGALIGNLVGFVSLANLVGDACLKSAYFAVFLYAVLRIADALLSIGLRIRPLRLLRIVQGHRDQVYQRLKRFFEWAAVGLWALRLMALLSLTTPLAEFAKSVLDATLKVGNASLSLGRVLAFVITVWAAFQLSRIVRFLLDEDVYPRVSLARGLPYAISTMLHYVILLVGFFVAVAAMGFDLTKFTILAGAFGVGLGFGMQNIVNNFVSGLILLFERPVKVGDVIQFGDSSGTVESIGIRASIIRTNSGSEIIVPNGALISERVTNWTFSNNLRNLVIPVTVISGTDPKLLIDLLDRVASAHPLVVKEPPPQALFVKLGPATLDFEMRAWTESIGHWEQIRSDLAVAIITALADEHIGMS